MADTPTPSATTQRPWLEYQHHEYARTKALWDYVQDHYTGDILRAENLKLYLKQKIQGESDTAYIERASLADYTPLFPLLVDTLAGMMASVESSANRQWNPKPTKGQQKPKLTLGDPQDQTTPIGKLFVRCDTDGNSYATVFRMLTSDLIAMHSMWGLVDAAPSGETRLRFLPPQCVVNWRYGASGQPEEVLVQEYVDSRTSIQDDPEQMASVCQYVLFTQDGWQRYRIDANNDVVKLTDASAGDFGAYRYETFDRQPALPIFPVRLPLRRFVGWLMAKKANVIFNQESSRDNLLRHANHPRLNIWGTKTNFDTIVAAIGDGSSALHNTPDQKWPHSYAAPDPGPATIATEVLKQKIEHYLLTGFRQYGDASKARQKTATEIRQDYSTGVGAFLQLVKAALDDAENQALWRIEQREFPNDRGKWFHAKVNRSDDFTPMDPEKVIQEVIDRVFGTSTTNAVPVGLDAQLAAAKQVADHEGLPWNEAQAKAALRASMLTVASENGAPLLPEAKAELAVSIMIASGLVAETDETTMDGDGTRPAIEVLRASALKQAQAEQDQKTVLNQGLGLPLDATHALPRRRIQRQQPPADGSSPPPAPSSSDAPARGDAPTPAASPAPDRRAVPAPTPAPTPAPDVAATVKALLEQFATALRAEIKADVTAALADVEPPAPPAAAAPAAVQPIVITTPAEQGEATFEIAPRDGGGYTVKRRKRKPRPTDASSSNGTA